jgi:hypothetical protein
VGWGRGELRLRDKEGRGGRECQFSKGKDASIKSNLLFHIKAMEGRGAQGGRQRKRGNLEIDFCEYQTSLKTSF